MGKRFKKGDRVRVIDAAGGGKLGDVATVIAIGDNGYYDLDGLSTGAIGLFGHRLELIPVTTDWQPKVGDRVRYRDECVSGEGVVHSPTSGGLWHVTVAEDDRAYAYYIGNTCRKFSLSEISPLPVAAEAQGVVIRAGAYYRTRDGRKVGPMERWHDEAEHPWEQAGGGNEFDSGGDIWRSDGTSEYNVPHLIAEWVDDPAPVAPVAASNDNAAVVSAETKAKFKVGDRVLVTHTDYPQIPVGTITHIVSIDDDGADLYHKDFGGGLYFYHSEFTIAPAAPTAIVALIENGQPKPSEKPRIHASQELAVAEAERLARIHRGQRFGIFVLADTRETDEPDYGHAWQNLAARGEKIAAIKELRSITGMGLKPAKDAVEYFLAAA